MFVEEVDRLGERENSGISRERNGHRRHDYEKGFHVMRDRLRGRCAREEREAKVDEDKVFCELGESGEDVFGRALGPSRHRVVRVVLERDPAEQEGDDPGHAETV